MAQAKKWDENQVNPVEIELGVKKSTQALALAEQLNAPDLIAQSRLLLAYCRLEQAGYDFIASISDKNLVVAERQKAIDKAFIQLKDVFNLYVQMKLDSMAGLVSDYKLDAAKKQGVELGRELEKARAAVSKEQ